METAGKKFVIHSLGCKVNQAESAWLEESLPFERQAEQVVPILFTCAVTNGASRQSRQMARRLIKAHGQVIVTGCDAVAGADSYGAIPGALLMDKERLLAATAPHVCGWLPGWRKPSARHTRAQLKVQDGCDAFCAYCIVPYTRGRPRSLGLEAAARAFAQLGQCGAGEVVLTGVHLGRYQADGAGLTGLLRCLLAAHEGPRIRLSSLEASEISRELLDMMAASARLCPHLHLPLQSGSDKVLAAMGRNYDGAYFAAAADRALAHISGLCLGVDIIAGFPGEDEDDFGATLNLLRALPLAYIHVFPFSPRPGVRAAQMPGQLPRRLIRRRALILRQLAQEKWLRYLRRQKGRQLLVLAENGHRGRAENYCPVMLPASQRAGELWAVNIKGVHGDGPAAVLQGELCAGPLNML
jgi:threonylcarbamoyladenosine tRNA methylthiotransferase MtaB